MGSNEAHLEFAPAPDGGQGRALVLAVAVHALLLLALNWGTLWSNQPQDMGVEAELWSAIPQPVAAKVEAPPEPDVSPAIETPPLPEAPAPKPPVAKPTEAPKPVVDPQIAIDKLKKKQAEEKQQQAQEDKKAKLKAEKEEQDKRKAQEKQETKEAEARHQAAVKRLQSMAGSVGTPVDTGVAPKPKGPSASWYGLIVKKVKENITLTDVMRQTIIGTPAAKVKVVLNPSGKIESVELLDGGSGYPAWDQAVLNAFYKMGNLPRDIDGTIPELNGILIIRP
jgi:colicin import membrane protein